MANISLTLFVPKSRMEPKTSADLSQTKNSPKGTQENTPQLISVVLARWTSGKDS